MNHEQVWSENRGLQSRLRLLPAGGNVESGEEAGIQGPEKVRSAKERRFEMSKIIDEQKAL